MAIEQLELDDSDIVAGQKIYASSWITRIANILTWANNQVRAKAVDKESNQLDIAGNKKFTGIVTLGAGAMVEGTPSASTHIASVGYVDDKVSLDNCQAVGTTDLTRSEAGDWEDIAFDASASVSGNALIITPTNGRALVMFSSSLRLSNGAKAYFRFHIDSTSNAHIIYVKNASGGEIVIPLMMQTRLESLSDDSHSIKVQWKIVAGTASLDGGTDENDVSNPRILTAAELYS